MKRILPVSALIMLMAAVSLTAVGTVAAGPRARAAAATPDCSDVTEWYWVVDGGVASYYVVDTGSGWVASYDSTGAQPFANVSLSVSGASLTAHATYINSTYTADDSGTLAEDCSAMGTFRSNTGDTGTFVATVDKRAPPGEIAGTVSDASGGPVARAQVELTGAGSQTVQTDSSGKYQVSLKAGSYIVTPSQPSTGRYIPSQCSGTVQGDGCAITLAAGGKQTASFKLSEGLTISGRVVTFQGLYADTRGLKEVTVGLDGADRNGAAVHLQTRTDEKGGYSFAQVPDGQYRVAPRGDPPPQPGRQSGPSDPPAPGRYAPTACDGTTVTGGCVIVTATATAASSPVADFAYGQDQRLTMTFTPAAVPGDGLGQSLLTISARALNGTAPGYQALFGREVLPRDNLPLPPDRHFVLCGTGQGGSPSYMYPRGIGNIDVLIGNTGADSDVHAVLYEGSAADPNVGADSGVRVREPVLNEDTAAALHDGKDPAPGSLTFADPVLAGVESHTEVAAPGRNVSSLEGLLEAATRSVGAPIGLAQETNPWLAQRLLLDWLVAIKARGLLPGIDFGPVHAIDQDSPAGVGVMFYDAGDTGVADQAEVLPFPGAIQGGPTPPFELRTKVLDLATAEAALSGAFRRPIPTTLKWLQNKGLIWSDVVADNSFAELEPYYVYFGWPYPPPVSTAGASLFYNCTQLQAPTVQIVVHSPIRLLITDARGRRLGYAGTKRVRGTLSGMMVVPKHGPQLYEFVPGHDHVAIMATGSGPASVEIFSPGKTLGAPAVFTFPVRAGQTGSLALTTGGHANTLRFAGHTVRSRRGVALRVSGLPTALPRRRRAFRLRITDQFGQPVPGVAVTARGRHYTTTATSDIRGITAIKLTRVHLGIVIRVHAPGCQTITLRLR